MRAASVTLIIGLFSQVCLAGSGGWIDYADETATRLIAAPNRGVNDSAEKDYAWGDVDQDGDIDIVCVRKTPFSVTCSGNPSLCPNVLFMNEGIAEGHAIDGIFVDRTLEFATDADDGGQGFFDVTNDRDVVLVDVDGDGWLDIVTATTLSDGLPKTISHPRIYMNKGEIAGVWQGFRYEQARIPQIRTIPAGVPVAPRFCSVDAGDITRDGDGRPDLYFGDYDSGSPGQQSGADVNDRLFINDGNGFFTDSLQTRMSSQMLLSAFGLAVAIEDMNNDGTLDVVKDTALNDPRRVSISYNDPDNEGFFDIFDVIANNAPYHISVGHLNNDNWLDVVVSDDAIDFYMLNQGNGGSGPVNFTNKNFGPSDDGFASNSLVADLNNDGHNDVLICDVDVDIGGCGRRLHIYRNLADEPLVTLQEQGGVAPWTPKGTHDVAVFDMNGDGWLDIFIGTCNTNGEKGTEIWINQPPFGMVFTYPDGLPAFVTPGAPFTFQVRVAGLGGGTPADDTGVLHLSVNGGGFADLPMLFLGSDTYEAEFPAGNCADQLNFYVTADLVAGGTFSDPPGAPDDSYEAVVATGTEMVFRDEIEGDVSGWTIISDASLTGGEWEQADPIGTILDGDIVAPDDDATAGAENVKAFITENGVPGGGPGAADVDGGPTYLISPVMNLVDVDATITYARWFFKDTELDSMMTEISNSGVDGPWTLVHITQGTAGEWETVSFNVGEFVTPTSTVHVRFAVADVGDPSFVEAGIDNFQLDVINCMVCLGDAECDDGDPCTDNTCESGACVVTNARGPCDDSDPCTENDECSAGVCVGMSIPGCITCVSASECDDDNDCTDDDCVGNICQNTPNADTCDDGNICTEDDACSGGVCSGALIPGCAACESNEDCDDGVFCNGTETCNGLTCDPGDDPCGNDECDEVTDTCTVALQRKMGEPVRGLTVDELARFEAGRTIFDLSISVEQGLGPIFNKESCGVCHNAGGLGGSGNLSVTRFGASDKGGFDPLAELGGSLLQAVAIDEACQEFIPPEATVTATRMTPSVFGGGLVETIPDAAIIANAAGQPASVSGTVHMVSPLEDPDGPLRVGRFGWKAQGATLLTFSGGAALNEMGLTNRLVPQENAPNGDMDLLALCDSVADPEDNTVLGNGMEFIDRTTDFGRFLAPPPQTPRSGMSGAVIFDNVGCADCHIASWTTGTAPEEALTSKIIQPYSDFLLHDMGLTGDGIVQGTTTPTEMRTSSLWGLRVRVPMMHDGGADDFDFTTRVTQAINAHNVLGSEAVDSALNYLSLVQADKDAVIAFLDSLGRAEFDHDGDDEITAEDFGEFVACFTGPGSFYTPDDACAISDVDQDGDVDDDDFDLFLLAFDGVLPDCNGNAVVDFREILDGTSPDNDGNGVLDQCSAPTVTVEGPRSLAVIPSAGPEDVAIVLMSPNTKTPCLTMYADATGELVDTPVYQSPALWEMVALRGEEIVPDTTYTIHTEFESGAVTNERTRHTEIWGDVDANGVSNLADVQLIVLGFQGTFDIVSKAALDLWPCTPNGFVNLDDAFRTVLAFQGQTYEETGCPLACP